jgi:DNA primase
LKNFPTPRIKPWEDEGIDPKIMRLHKICYDPKTQSIIIPHYDINNQLIGIRERTLVKENEVYGKYKPAIFNKKMYNHALSFNLYNINWSKANISNFKKVIVYESEKSTLQYASHFSIENDISVAVCGSNLVNYQVSLLLSLGVEEIIIAFDRQYKEAGDDEYKKWVQKFYDIHNKYGKYVQISYILDKKHLLDYKDSPIDKGKDVFLKLFQERVII